MKKRLFGLVAMMLAAMIFVLAVPVQVKAENYYNVADLEYGAHFDYGDNIYLNLGDTIQYYVDKTPIASKSSTMYLVLNGDYYPSEGNLYFDRYTKDGTESGLYHAYLVTTLKANTITTTEESTPKISPAEQAISDYNEAWNKIQKEITDETQLPAESFITAQAIAPVPEIVKSNSAAIVNLSTLKNVPGVMALITKAQKVATGDKVTIYTEKPATFSKEGFEAISSMNKTVVYAFKIDGKLYQITIPAGAKIDFGDNGFAGPLWVGAQLGTTVVLE